MKTRRRVNVEDLNVGDFVFVDGCRAITGIKIMPRKKKVMVKHTGMDAKAFNFGDTLLVYLGLPS